MTNLHKKARNITIHDEVATLTGLFVDEPTMTKNLGRRCIFKSPTCPGEFGGFTICGVQKIYDGTLAYRIVSDKDVHRFGRPAKESQISFL